MPWFLFKIIFTLIVGSIAFQGFSAFKNPRSLFPKIQVKNGSKKKKEVQVTLLPGARFMGLLISIIAVLMAVLVWSVPY